MRNIDRHQRRARLVRRHKLAGNDRASSVSDVTDAVIGLHSSDPASVHLSAVARATHLTRDDIERELYDERPVARILGMRRTLFVVARGLVPVIHAACTRKIALTEHRRLLKLLGDAGIGGSDPEAWVADVKAKVLAVLAEEGEASGRDLSAAVPELRTRIELSPGKAYGGTSTLTTLVLSRMPMDGTIVRVRPLGTWLSAQYRYAPMADIVADVDQLETGTASVDLLRRYLRAFGPVTFADCQWWTGWTKTQTRTALEALDPAEVDMDGTSGLVLADDVDIETGPLQGDPVVTLLPALDPTTMGWRQRDWFLGGHGPALFDTNGNAGPTVWVDGRVVGGWAQRPDGTVVHRVLEEIGADAEGCLTGEAERLTTWMDGSVVTPRFRTPLERSLMTVG